MTAITVAGLTKTYRIASSAQRALGLGALGDVLARARRRERYEEHVALRSVDLTVEEGEVLGLVGRNGAGKSTLLKILSRIVEPDGGEARVRGRIGSLLEVGTGFHPELTGRENVFLNGAILGMRRTAIARAFDSIVDFADVERFLDTPVKRYSSGMYVRLAFAVAAHLDTEILLVDEVLAVGDAAFQAKCLRKIGEVASTEGRTVVFVSHNMAAIESLCGRAVFLEAGEKRFDGPVRQAIARYYGETAAGAQAGAPGEFDLRKRVNEAVAGAPPVMTKIRLVHPDGRPAPVLDPGDALCVVLELDGMAEVRDPVVVAQITDDAGRPVCTFSTRMSPLRGAVPPPASAAATLHVPALPLAPGSYWIGLGIKDRTHDRPVDHALRAARFDVTVSDFYGTGYAPTSREGDLLLRHDWTIEERT